MYMHYEARTLSMNVHVFKINMLCDRLTHRLMVYSQGR